MRSDSDFFQKYHASDKKYQKGMPCLKSYKKIQACFAKDVQKISSQAVKIRKLPLLVLYFSENYFRITFYFILVLICFQSIYKIQESF